MRVLYFTLAFMIGPLCHASESSILVDCTAKTWAFGKERNPTVTFQVSRQEPGKLSLGSFTYHANLGQECASSTTCELDSLSLKIQSGSLSADTRFDLSRQAQHISLSVVDQRATLSCQAVSP